MTGNAGRVVATYSDAGWGIVLPLPPRKKKSPPEHTTGRYDAATPADARRWLEDGAYGNFAMRAPQGVLGIDFDERKGGSVFPWVRPFMDAAPRSTARGGDNPSGIYWVRVPAHLVEQIRDRHLAEFGTEAIRHGHRYGVVWPSVNPDAGDAPYQWYAAGSSSPMGGPPAVGDLPEIPEDVVLAGMKAADQKAGKRSSVDGSGLRVPARAIEASELGGIRAAIAGYHPYEVRPGAAVAAARTEWEQAKVQALTDDLEALTTSSDPWEPSVGSIALALFSVALAPWSQLTPEAALELVVEHGPSCEKAQAAGVHGHTGTCWTATNLAARARRSLSQHDGGWTQLPGELRGAVLPGQPADQPADDEFDGAGGDDGGDDGADDDFFDDDEGDDEPEFVWLTDELPIEDPPEPLLGGMLYSGVLNVVTGLGGTGKSTLVTVMCAQTPTMWLSNEEAQSSIHQRAAIIGSESFVVPTRVMTDTDIPKITDFLSKNPGIKTLVIDNLQSFFTLKENANLDNVVRERLGLLTAYTIPNGITIVGITHPTKDGSSDVAGSRAWVNVARHVLLAQSVHLNEEHHVILGVRKSNVHRGMKRNWLAKTRSAPVPRLTVSGRQEQDWTADWVDDDAAINAALEALEAARKAGGPAKASTAPGRTQKVVSVDSADAVSTEWTELAALAARFGVSPSALPAALRPQNLALTKAGSGRLGWIHRADDNPIAAEFSVGEHNLETLVRQARVSQTTHLLWILADHGINAEINQECATLSYPEQDEVDEALRDAGLDGLE